MEMELKLRFMNCLLCDVNFCPVELVPHSEDEKLLDVFCKYFDLPLKEMESLYDKNVGFPFCETCREETLLKLSDFHNKFTSIQKDISQLVTSVSVEVVKIINKHNDDDDEEEEGQNTQSFTTQILYGIRKIISTRYKPNVVLMDFCTLFNQQRKKSSPLINQINRDNNLLCQKYMEREENDYDFNIKKEAWTPMYNPEDYNDERDFPSTTSSQPPPQKRRKQEFHTISDFQEQTPKIVYVVDYKTPKKVNINNQSSYKTTKVKTKTKTPPKKVQGKNKEVKGKTRPTITKFKEDESDYVSEDDGPEPEENEPISDYELDEDENEDSFTDSDDSSPPVPKNPKPKKKIIGPAKKPTKSVYSVKYDRLVNDPTEEIEPGLFKRKRSGWSFRKETNEEGEEIYKCLADDCQKTCKLYTAIAQHVSLTHAHEWIKCDICKRKFHNQKKLDAHAHSLTCKPLVRAYKNRNQGNGQWIYTADNGEIFPYHEVDKIANRGFSMQCGTCAKLERDRFKMSSHIHSKHVVRNRFMCDLCVYACANASQLKMHQLSHQEEKSFVCELCGSKFKSSWTLKKHIEKHEKGKKSWKCDWLDCGRGFSCLNALNRHRKSVGHPKQVDPEPALPVEITCPKCQRVYLTQGNYDRHSKKCKGKQRIPCLLCDKSSVDRSSLRTHFRLVHPTEFDNYRALLYTQQDRITSAKISTAESLPMEQQVQENVVEQL